MIPRAVDALAVTAWVLAVGWNGAESLLSQAVVGVALAAAAVALAVAPGVVVAGRARVAWVLASPALALLGCALWLIPLPPAVLAAVFPTTAAAYPGVWHAASIRPEATAGDAVGWALVAAGMVVAARTGRSRIRVERGVAVGVLVAGSILLGHLALQPSAMYGLWPVAAEGVFWAPLVNRNFLAFALLGVQPLLWGALIWKRDLRQPWTWLQAAAALTGLAILVGSGSLASWVAGAYMLACAGILYLVPKTPRAALAAGAIALCWAVVLGVDAPWLDDSFASRADIWTRSLGLWLSQPLGIGPGAWGHAIQPFQEPFRFVRVEHAHSDWLEGLVEWGLPGAALILGPALWAWLRAPNRAIDHRSTWLDLGLIGWALHAALDFPAQLPGLAMLVGGALAWRVTAWEGAPKVEEGSSRALAWGAAGVVAAGGALAAGLWALAVPDGQEEPHPWDPVVRAVAPWRPGPTLREARQLARDGDAERARALLGDPVARWPDDPEALLQAGAIYAHLRDLTAARASLDRAIERHAADHRARALASRVAEAQGDRSAALARWVEATRRWPFELASTDKPFERALRLEPSGLWWVEQLEDQAPAATLTLLGQHLLRQGDPQSAFLAYDRAAERWPRYRCLPERGEALVGAGLTTEGLDLLRSCDEAEPRARLTRARVLATAGRWPEALEDARVAHSRDPNSLEAKRLVVRASAEVDGPSAAVKSAERLGRPGFVPAELALEVARAARHGKLWTDCVRWVRPLRDDHEEAATLLRFCEDRCDPCTP